MKSIPKKNNSEPKVDISKPFFKPSTIQAKLKIGQANDKYEQEADMMADKVVNNSTDTRRTPAIQMMAAGSIDKLQRVEEEEPLQMKEEEEETIQLKEEEEESLQMKEEGRKAKRNRSGDSMGSHTIQGKSIQNNLSASKGKGNAMSTETKSSMENAFGTDFSSVKIHTDTSASQMSRDIHAKAFTNGSDIYFNKGQYDPGSTSGKRLLAHELTHVVQQGGAERVNFIQRDLAVDPPNPDAEVAELTEEEIRDAIEYNSRRFRDENELMNLRDVLGQPSEPAVMDEETVRGVLQFQAENTLDQDGKIGPLTARVIGREMLEESKSTPGIRRNAVKMLERGITLTLANNSYADTATTSQKHIKFDVNVPRGLNMRNYALVNFLRGNMIRMPGASSPNVMMYGSAVPFNFPVEQVDSVDVDPIYWSSAGSRWNYNVSGRRFSATDNPSIRASKVYNIGESADVHFRIGVFKISDLPATTSGAVGNARPLIIKNWRFSILRDGVTGNISHP